MKAALACSHINENGALTGNRERDEPRERDVPEHLPVDARVRLHETDRHDTADLALRRADRKP